MKKCWVGNWRRRGGNRKGNYNSFPDKGRCIVIYSASRRSLATLTNRMCNRQPVYKSRHKLKFYCHCLRTVRNPVAGKNLAFKFPNRKQQHHYNEISNVNPTGRAGLPRECGSLSWDRLSVKRKVFRSREVREKSPVRGSPSLFAIFRVQLFYLY